VASNVAAELAKLDQSSGKTAGLNHVTKDMKASANKDPVIAPKAPAPKKEDAPVGKQVFALQGTKWQVEGQTGTITIKADEVSVKHTVYIYNCVGATIIVEGKVNTITVDSCKKTQVIFQDVLALCETVNSKQIKGRAPTISIDKTDGIVIYLSRETMFETKIVAAKSSEMNVQVPGKTDDDAWVEKVLPEQFVYNFQPDYTIKCDVSDLYSHGG
jgi:adenylyl cyclase-associated protein